MVRWTQDHMDMDSVDKVMVIKLIEMEKDQSQKVQGKGILDRAFGLVIKTP